nr:immunoglobulin light chain junction region [Mus musculus]NSL98675.1 immunoglobulin light chain junction region [Mus musculus]NSL98863.1 immunoglobulin light chain junction region [Mus musculus]NSL98953.1 immunoglobulin light chain junction region [Mus musculus]NSM01602.1 immunoglobulin light chain junction region [Mus musculus]
CQQYWSIPFTF